MLSRCVIHSARELIIRLSDVWPLATPAPINPTNANCFTIASHFWEVYILLCIQQHYKHTGRPTTQKRKRSPRRGSFVTLMIIYNNRVACLCGPHSAAALRLHLPCIFGKQNQMWAGERVWIRWDLYKRRIISDDIALANTVPTGTALCHKYWPLVAPAVCWLKPVIWFAH